MGLSRYDFALLLARQKSGGGPACALCPGGQRRKLADCSRGEARQQSGRQAVWRKVSKLDSRAAPPALPDSRPRVSRSIHNAALQARINLCTDPQRHQSLCHLGNIADPSNSACLRSPSGQISLRKVVDPFLAII